MVRTKLNLKGKQKMSKFSFTDVFDTKFEDDVITATLSKLKRKDYLTLTPFVKTDQDGVVKMSFEDEQKFLDVASDLLPAYVTDFIGLTDNTGSPVSLEAVVEHVYFLQITSELVGALMANSGLQEEEADVKNSDGQSEVDTTD
jgi:hypothetical protein